MIIHNGDHAEFEIEHANTKPEDRPDWPLPSFDARDWAKAFCKNHPGFDEGTALAWFANALMRGYDERTIQQPRETPMTQHVGKGFRWFFWYALALLIAMSAVFWARHAFAQAPRTATITFTRPLQYTDGTDIGASTAISYRVMQGLKGATKGVAGTITATSTTINTGLQGGNEYCWQVIAIVAGRPDSDPSNEACKAFPASGPASVTITVT